MALGKQNRRRLVGAAAPDEVKTPSAAQRSMSLTSMSSHGDPLPSPSVSQDMIGTESPAL
jgi:hypothetical protein